MLLTYQQMVHLEPDGEERYKFIDDGTATEREKEELLDLDADYYEIYHQHLITNLNDLKS